VLERERPSATPVGLGVMAQGAIEDSAEKNDAFWAELRLLFADTLDVRADFPRRAEVQRAYERELRDPKELMAALELARTNDLVPRVVDIDGAGDLRLSALQALAVGTLTTDDVVLVELVPKDAKPETPAKLVLGLFARSSQGYVYLGNLDAFKDGPVAPEEREPRKPPRPAPAARGHARGARAPGGSSAGGKAQGPASDAERYVFTITP
jgi:hypothetical protein